MVLLLLLAADRHCGSEMRPSQPAIMCDSSVPPSHLTSALTSTFHIQAQCAFTGFVRFEGSVVRLTLSVHRHWYTPSSHPVLMAAMPCWPGCQKPPLIVFSVCSMQQLESSVELKFDHGLTHLLHSKFRWLDVPQRIQFKLGVTVHKCLRGNAPQ